ncbi:hypothetical protein C8Q79DRAFT_587086 [Trametes meyenii]|nr:hypothetical protein C8Q79DRAFT_587086 [Trametes meyenii]
MPRRSPPTPLRLHNGPLPARGKPKHTLPSLPRPAFCGPAPSQHAGPVPRARMQHTELPALVIPDPTTAGLPSGVVPALFGAMAMAMAMESASGPSSPTSAASSVSSAYGYGHGHGGAGTGAGVPRKKSREFVRGPWDHSGAIHVPFDVGAVLPPPRPAAINVR